MGSQIRLSKKNGVGENKPQNNTELRSILRMITIVWLAFISVGSKQLYIKDQSMNTILSYSVPLIPRQTGHWFQQPLLKLVECKNRFL